MISIKNKNLFKLIKLVFIFLFGYSLVFFMQLFYITYQSSEKKDVLLNKIHVLKIEHTALKTNVHKEKGKITLIKKSYLSKEELERKISAIFLRLNFLDFEIVNLASRKMCINRYILINKIKAKDEKALKAAQHVLSFLGESVVSKNDSSIYYVNYKMEEKND